VLKDDPVHGEHLQQDASCNVHPLCALTPNSLHFPRGAIINTTAV